MSPQLKHERTDVGRGHGAPEESLRELAVGKLAELLAGILWFEP